MTYVWATLLLTFLCCLNLNKASLIFLFVQQDSRLKKEVLFLELLLASNLSTESMGKPMNEASRFSALGLVSRKSRNVFAPGKL